MEAERPPDLIKSQILHLPSSICIFYLPSSIARALGASRSKEHRFGQCFGGAHEGDGLRELGGIGGARDSDRGVRVAFEVVPGG